MERLEFIEKIFTLYRVNPENNKDLVRIYDEAFSVHKPVDWDKLYKRILNSAEGGLPKPGWFVSQFDGCLKKTDYITADGLKIRVNLKDGYNYEFETYQTDYTLPEIKQKFMKRYKKKFISLEHYWESDNPDKYEYKWSTI